MMAQYLNDELEYIVDDYFDKAKFDDNKFRDGQRQAIDGSNLKGDIAKFWSSVLVLNGDGDFV